MSDPIDELAVQMTEFFTDRYGEELGVQVYVNLMEAMKPFEEDGDLYIGTHKLEIFIDEDTGNVTVSKVEDHDEDDETA